MQNRKLRKSDVAAIERRAARNGLTMGELCLNAGIAHSTWSRAKARGAIRVGTIRKLEAALIAGEGGSNG